MPNDPGKTVCSHCALKHLSGARTVFMEMLNGYGDKPNHLVDFIGDMYSAEKHAGVHTPRAEEIRTIRLHVTDLFMAGDIKRLRDNPDEAVPLLDHLDCLTLQIAEELVKEAAEFESLGAISGDKATEEGLNG